MNDLRTCSQCHQAKEPMKDFYLCSGRWRSECKMCTIIRNVKYQRKVKTWKCRYEDDEARKLYMREYYKNNKEKFARYREEFRSRYPGYYKEYFRKRKEKE